MNGTFCAIKPLMKATSRDNRSSLATRTGHFALRARQRGGQLRTPVERVAAALARLDFDEFAERVIILQLP